MNMKKQVQRLKPRLGASNCTLADITQLARSAVFLLVYVLLSYHDMRKSLPASRVLPTLQSHRLISSNAAVRSTQDGTKATLKRGVRLVVPKAYEASLLVGAQHSSDTLFKALANMGSMSFSSTLMLRPLEKRRQQNTRPFFTWRPRRLLSFWPTLDYVLSKR